MGWFKNWRLAIFHKRLAAKQQAQKSNSNRSLVSLSKAQSIGVLFDATELKERNVVLDWAEKWRKKGKKVQVLGLVRSKKPVDNLPFATFTLKDVDFFYCPKGEAVDHFQASSFDVFVNTMPADFVTATYLATLHSATCRVSPSPVATASFELMIEVNKPYQTTIFLSQLEHYLAILTQQNESNLA